MEIGKPLLAPATPPDVRADVAELEQLPRQAEVAQRQGLDQICLRRHGDV